MKKTTIIVTEEILNRILLDSFYEDGEKRLVLDVIKTLVSIGAFNDSFKKVAQKFVGAKNDLL